jgi:general secretion pathway protein A
MNALGYWKLGKNPFAAESASYFVAGPIEEAVARIQFLVESKRHCGLLVGSEGSGKTSLLRYCSRLTYRVPDCRRVQIFYGSARGLSGDECLAGLVASIEEGRSQVDRRADRQSMHVWTALNDLLVAYRAMDLRLVWFIDDVNESPSLFPTLTRLFAMNTPLTILLGSSVEHQSQLPSRFSQWSELRVELPAWELGLTADYFDFAIESTGGRPSIFDAQSITRIHEISEGIPRRIIRLADLSLFAGAAARVSRISVDTVEEVCQEVEGRTSHGKVELASLSRI